MEEKETKKLKKQTMTADKIEALKQHPETIPLRKASFHTAILMPQNMPETSLFAFGTHKLSRLAKMWYTPMGILIEQKNEKGKVEHKIVHAANAYDTVILHDEY